VREDVEKRFLEHCKTEERHFRNQTNTGYVQLALLAVFFPIIVYMVKNWYEDTVKLKERVTIMETNGADFQKSVDQNFREIKSWLKSLSDKLDQR
jgi:ABC-type anion transport system duplicated permease subunit